MSHKTKPSRSIEILLTVSDVANFLGVSKAFIYREIAARNLAIYRLRGQSIRIGLNDLTRYLEQHHHASLEPIKSKRSHF